MNNSNNPLRLNVGYFYNKAIGTSREVPIDVNHLKIDDLTVKELTSLVKISRTREGLLLQVTADARVETECSRCLVDFFLPIQVTFEELYQFPSRFREDTDLVLPDDGYIDLRPIYREYLILALPMKRLCRPECKGLCEVCGADLNKGTCEHQDITASLDEVGDDDTVV